MSAAIALAAGTACLGSIPEPTRCPAEAVHESCFNGAEPPNAVLPGGTDPFDAGPSCGVAESSCFRATHGGECACTPAGECARSPATCFPSPDCPNSIASAVRDATCLETNTEFGSPRNGAPVCVCGCPSCASTCDGQGPVLGPNQVLRIHAVDRGSSGKHLAGLMVRLRGTGSVSVTLEPETSGSESLLVGEIRAGSEFSEVLAGGARPFSGFIVGDAGANAAIHTNPSALAIRTEDGIAEIDCAVPYMTP